MSKLEQRAADVARGAQARRIAEIAGALASHGLTVEERRDGVEVRGRGLIKRWLNEASLRFITGLMQ